MIRRPQFLSLVREGQFKDLFITELGWNRYRGQSSLPTITIDDVNYNIDTIAERNGFQILYSEVDEIPTQAMTKKIDTKLRRQAQDYILIFRKRDSAAHDLWVVPIRTNEKRDIVLLEYDNGNAEVIYQKIEGITFELGEESNIVDLRAKVQTAFTVNSEKITKDFYAGFKKEHKAFADFITGIDDHIETKDNRNKQWYTSVMLNRLMFCYFIQKKGFLNFDTNYLKNKLDYVRTQEGENQFYNFYRSFLCQLFSDGLNTLRHTREFEQIFGKIPYLNGGMFDRHQLEREYPDIDIPDEAFMGLFDFFDKWNWHLDTRITASGKDINPDVLGYIFEQYINDRAQMGAYYTKEDITEYIGRNCILPFLFDKVGTSRAMSDYFKSDGLVWQTLRNSGDRYIFDAVKKGYKDFDEIPEEIKRGIITDSMRKEYSETPIGELPEDHVPLSELRSEWNRPTPEQWGLPTEIWRETIERLQRCEDILHKIERGEITSINDFITYNLDIRNFAIDLLAQADRLFVKHFYEALQGISILDPTCGSGAFLFAAMNILEPLYEICIDRMQEDPEYFKVELAEITDKYRSNIQYFIFKSIILRNLYGVDIMVEATEIAKLRLFLKMVAVVDVDRRADNLGLDPLPDIDFNIRCGNTLVGYANQEQLDKDLSDNQGNWEIMLANEEFKEKIENELRTVARAYEIFKEVQLRQEEDMAAFKQAKTDLSDRLNALNYQLNQRLWKATRSDMPFDKWLVSHQPFNWISEFFQIIQGNGGFDVIISNPPYVVYNASIFDYRITNYKTVKARNLYAFCIERSMSLVTSKGIFSMIVPISLSNGKNYSSVRELLSQRGIIYYAHFAGDSNPCYIFNGVKQNLTIFFSNPYSFKQIKRSIYTTNYIKSFTRERTSLFQLVSFYNFLQFNSEITRIGNLLQDNLINKYLKKIPIVKWLSSESPYYIYYKNTSGAAYKPFFKNEPMFEVNGNQLSSTTIDYLMFKSKSKESSARAFYNSNFFNYLYFLISDARHITSHENIDFIYINDNIENDISLHQLDEELQKDLLSHSTIVIYKRKQGETKYRQFKPRLSKPIIDEIDKVLAKHYGFTDEELDFIINYDIKYRMGDELNNDK